MKCARRPLVTLAAAALLLAGCGGGGDSTPEPKSEPDAPARADLCVLLTASDIEDALGKNAGEPEPGDEALGQCTWPASDGGDPVAVLTLERAVLGSFDEFVEEFGEEFGGENPPQDEYHPVDGVPGDWAMYVAEEHMVRAFRGDNVLEVSSAGADEAQVIDLATRAMGRLP